MSPATPKPIRLECYLPRLSGANKVCFEPTVWSDTCCSAHEIRVSLQCSYKYGHACRNKRSQTCLRCIPSKCWFAVLRRFCLQCSRTLRRRSTAARLIKLWVRIPPGAWMFFCCECRVLSGRGLCDELITSPEESHRVWSGVMCNLESS